MEITRDSLENYHRGNCTPEQKEAVENWLKGQDLETNFPAGMGDGKILEEMMWSAMSENLGFVDIERTDNLSDSVGETTNERSFIPARFWRVAASLVITAAIGYLFWFLTNQKVTEENTALSTEKKPTIEYVTKAGERKKYTLPDGSQVTLNAESEISYPSMFLATDTLRKIYLKGEAFFSVVKDPKRPFLVHTARSLVRVLGTRFNLKAYEMDEFVILVVEEGKVKFSNEANNRHVILTANELGTLNSSGSLEEKNVYANRYFAWKENKLVFENHSLASIATDLERWYGIEVRINNAQLKANRYTGSFTSKPIEEVLETMSYAVGFKYRMNENTITIY